MRRREFLAIAGSTPLAASPAAAPAGAPPADLRFRQVHLDFHTSEHISGIGEAFDPEAFARTVEEARVNSITCFARCHHGWIYFDTKAFPERRHPHLRRNLLKEQIEACHRRNIRVPIYTTIQWDHYTATRHPEWLVLDEKGAPVGTPTYEAGFYRRLCVNSPYRQFLQAHLKEIFEAVPVDGLFLDIVGPMDCSCRYCRERMEAARLDPSDAAARRRFGLAAINEWKHETTRFIRQFSKDCTIFYNAGHIGPRHRSVADAYTHFELESLPSGGWGYLDFPLKVRYTRTLGIESLGMTGKFHTSWGDFHSFKNPAALQFECFQMLALGAKCSVGDQLHPAGKLDAATYNLIGSVYREVEKKEPWCAGARPVVDIGVLTPEEFLGVEARSIPSAFGAVRLLQESALQFDVLDSASDFSRYKLLVLPDEIPCNPALAAKIDAFVQHGGALLASFAAGLDEKKERFALQSLGVSFKGDAPYSPDFLVPKGALGAGLPSTEHVMYLKGKLVEPAAGAEVLAETIVPYFNRTWQHFSSHRHTPSAGKAGYPGIVRNGRAVYFMHPVFTQYNKNAPRWVKRLVANAIGMLLPDPLVRMDAPSTALVSVNDQPRENRWVVHLLHYIPERRGQDFDIIEDVIPLLDVKVSVRAPRPVKQVLTAPQGRALQFSVREGRTEFVLPRLDGHQMIALQFG